MRKTLALAALMLTFAGSAKALCTSCWDRVAACESGGRWNYNGSSGFDGGLQFLPSTWLAYGGGQYAPYAHMASRLQQMTVASRLPLSSWPYCGRRYYG